MARLSSKHTSYAVSAKLQKLTVITLLALWLVPFVATIYYTYFSRYSPGEMKWEILLIQSTQIAAPLVYFGTCLFSLRNHKENKLGWVFHAALVAFIASTLATLASNLIQLILQPVLSGANYNHSYLQSSATFFAPQIAGLLLLIGYFWHATRREAKRG